MKHLKTYEDTIKHSDELALNHPLRDFSRKLEDVIIAAKNDEIEKEKLAVRRYFNDNGSITIKVIFPYGNRLKIKLKLSKDNYVNIEFYFSSFREEVLKNFVEFLKETTLKYNVYNSPYKIVLNFQKSKLDEVLDKIQDYYTIIKMNKFNL